MAFFLVGAAIVGSSIATAAYGAKQSRKAQKRAREDANQAALIEGSAPNISNVEEIQNLDVQGTQPAGLEEALAAMDYEAQAAGEKVPVPGEAGQNPMGDISEEELMLLMQSPEFMGLGAQETQYAASGGAVGTPEDVYYFGVPQIMGMMQDPNPQIQGVGMQLADQMSAMPDAGMVPATANQIQTMAYGGAVTAKKLRDGGPPQTGSRTDENLERIQQIIKESGRSKLLSQLGLSDDFGRVDQEDRLLNELIEKLNLPVDIEKEGDNYSVSKTFADEDASLQLGISRLGMSAGDQYIPPGETAYYLKGERRFADGSQGGIENYDPELDADFIAQQEAFEELLELNGLVDKGVISEARAEHDRQLLMGVLQTGRRVSDSDRKNLRKKANGGPITSDRLNQLRLR